MEWSKHPSFERDAEVVTRILSKGAVMCRDEISDHYIRSAMQDSNVAVWLVRDANERIFGFALTKQRTDHLELKLICTHKRKGEGGKLFRDILNHTRETNEELRLHAVNSKVAKLYASEANKLGHSIYLNDEKEMRPLSKKRIEEAIDRIGRMIPMRFTPPGWTRSHASSNMTVHSYKALMRRLNESDDEDD